jgi:hypothetical protein
VKGHDGLCPSPNPHLIDRKHCAYCNLIETVKEHYKSKTGGGTYEDGVRDGFADAIRKLTEA